jgi:hypothetical protein
MIAGVEYALTLKKRGDSWPAELAKPADLGKV